MIDHESYLELLPKNLLMDGGGSSGGGTQSTQTQAQYMPWAKYVPKETYEGYKKGMTYAGGKVGQGLAPEEKAYYKGQTISDIGGQYAGAQKNLNESLARSGVKGGAAAEAMTDLARSKVTSTAAGLSDLTGKDITEKRANLEEFRRWIGLPGSPIQTGSTSTTTSQPSGGGMS